MKSLNRKKSIGLYLVLIALAVFSWPVAAGAQEVNDVEFLDPNLVEDPNLPEEPRLPGRIEGIGTYFEVADSDYLDITFESSEPVHLVLESMPQMIVMDIEAAEDATSTEITLTAFPPSSTYYKYEDDYHNGVVFTTDGNGSYTYLQDIACSHLVFIQAQAGTRFIPSDTEIGVWDPNSRTYTLTTDVYETIQIDEDNLTLDGAGHTVTGPGSGNGIMLSGRTGVTVKDISVQEFSSGINLWYSSGNTLISNTISNTTTYNRTGIKLHRSNDNTLTDNTTSNNSYGIKLGVSSNNTLSHNTASNNQFGIHLGYSSHNNILTSNIANNNSHSGMYVSSSNNMFIGNNTSSNGFGIILSECSNNTLTDNTASDNETGIRLGSYGSNTLRNNLMSGNRYNFMVVDYFNNDIDNSNLVDGKPIYYIVGASGTVVDSSSNAGVVYCIGCDNVTVKDLSLTNEYAGIYFYNTINSSIQNNQLNNNATGIYLNSSSGSNLSDNTTSNNNTGINLNSSNNNSITGNTASENATGILLNRSSGNTLIGNTASNNSGSGIYLYASAGNTVTDNNTSNNNERGMLLSRYSNSNTITGNTVNDNGAAIRLWNTCQNNTITGNTASGNRSGISLFDGSNGNTLIGNTVCDNFSGGFYLDHSNSNTLADNNVSNSNNYSSGIELYISRNNTITSNAFSNNKYGIYFDKSGGNILRNNVMSGNSYNFVVWGSFDNDIDTSNLIDGKPIYYIVGASGTVVDSSSNAGVVYCINCDGITVKDLSITNKYIGVFFYDTINSRIENNYLYNNENGIYLNKCSNNTVTDNIAIGSLFGIYFDHSNDNAITANTVSQNQCSGIYLTVSKNNSITRNTISNNFTGIELAEFNYDNEIYFNNLINNTAYDRMGSGNVFNLDRPIGGNYWSNWTTPDNDADGFVDSPYVFSGGRDNLPWANQDGWLGAAPTTLSEEHSNESTLIETILSQKANLTDVAISGDFESTLDFTNFEIVSIETGSFAGKGFSKGQFETTLEGVSYIGSWQGISFLKPQERKIYLKGLVTGEIVAIVEGYITESTPESSIYDQYQATWKIVQLGTTITSATINLDGILTYQDSSEYPSTELYVLQTNIEGTLYGHYSGALSTVINHVRIADANNVYDGEGFSIISYVSEIGSGQGWTYDKLVSRLELRGDVVITVERVEMEGFFDGPLYGIISGRLYESVLPRNLHLTLERVDLGLPPMADLEIKTWGPDRVSPGQTINYVVEYRNDGLRIAENMVVVAQLPSEVEYISSTNDGIYKWETHEVIWKLGVVSPKVKGNLAITVRVQWGLPWGTQLGIAAIIDTSSDEVDTFLNPEVAIYNLEEYLAYEHVDIVSANSLTQGELEYELSDPNFLDLYAYSLEKGFDDTNCPLKINYSDGSAMTIILMVSDSQEEIEFVVKLSEQSNMSYIIRIDQATISFLNRGGGFLFDNDTNSLSFWGEHHSCNWAECVNGCLGEKIGKYGLGKALGKLTKRLWDVFWASYDCSACVLPTTPPEMRKKYCKACLLDIPGAKEGWEIGKCIMDCVEDVNSHGCEYCNDCYKCSSWIQYPVSYYAKFHCDENCLQQPVLGGGRYCPTGSICRQISKCEVKCLPKDNSGSGGSTVATARDPSVKYGPEGRVSPGQRLDYIVEYENEGEGIAFGVYFTDTLDQDLDDSSLEIDPVVDVNDGSIISGPGIYNPATRTITWFAGEVGPGQGGITSFSVNVRNDAPDGTEIINYATIYFPSVPEETRTNGIVSIVSLNQPPVATCQDVTVVASVDCKGDVSAEDVDNGSYDPDGDVITLSLNPPGPYPLGVTNVTLTVSDGIETDTCQATVTVVTAPGVTYDGDTLLSTGGNPTVDAVLVATLRDEYGVLLDAYTEEITFTLTAEGVETIVVTTDTVGGIAQATQALEPAIYMIEVTLKCSEATATSIQVVYNPEGGFATGGGWIVPEADGLNTHPDERANFGFNAKYKQDVSIGHLEFRYSDGYIDLKSSSIEQLVITGGKIAQFKGWASVNGENSYWFFVKAIDNGEPGTNDIFEIKIWNPGSNIDGDYDEIAGGVLQGGNILVHTKDK